MSEIQKGPDLVESFSLLAAAAEDRLSPGAVENIRNWLSESRYAEYAPWVASHLAEAAGATGEKANQLWKLLDDVFWRNIPFGTGGRRGQMYPIGSNAINDRTIGESAQGLANYLNKISKGEKPLACAIAYDTRHRSPEFARLCAEVMAAAGFKVYFLNGFRSTPELSFAVRRKQCDCGIMVSASHNPPSDNAIKVYWSTGGQMLPPHDKGVIEHVLSTDTIDRTAFEEALQSGKIVCCQEEIDTAFIRAVAAQGLPGPRKLKIVYSPLHGVGASAVMPALEADGFDEVELFALQAEPDGDFPNVPDHVSNPENPAVFDVIIERCKQNGADLALATDPDCDRVGCAAPLTQDSTRGWETINGNQIGALLADYILESRRDAGTLSSDHYVIKTLVTTELIRRIADAYGVKTLGNLLVGFKWIGGMIDQAGPEHFVFGAEESHGYLVGTYARDKDAAVAAMLLAELAAKVKSEGKTLHQKLDELFLRHGCYAEKTISVKMPGSEGMSNMKALMARIRSDPPKSLAGFEVQTIRDYSNQTITQRGGEPQTLEGPVGGDADRDMVILDFAAEDNRVAVRPSGTEPKVKFYMFAREPPENLTDINQTKMDLKARIEAIQRDLEEYAKIG